MVMREADHELWKQRQQGATENVGNASADGSQTLGPLSGAPWRQSKPPRRPTTLPNLSVGQACPKGFTRGADNLRILDERPSCCRRSWGISGTADPEEIRVVLAATSHASKRRQARQADHNSPSTVTGGLEGVAAPKHSAETVDLLPCRRWRRLHQSLDLSHGQQTPETNHARPEAQQT